jgi:hypothetical protein
LAACGPTIETSANIPWHKLPVLTQVTQEDEKKREHLEMQKNSIPPEMNKLLATQGRVI